MTFSISLSRAERYPFLALLDRATGSQCTSRDFWTGDDPTVRRPRACCDLARIGTSTATAQASGTPSTVATLAASTSNSYSSQYRTLALNDSFAETVATWDASSTCQFTNKAYNVTTVRGFTLCKDNATSDSYNNFVYQVQMQFLTQDTCGGLLFRNQTSSLLADYYEFYICTDGTYHLGAVGGLYNSLADGSSLFNTELGQANVIAVVAQKTQLTIYINGKMVNQASDDHFSGGAIGLFAFNLTNHSSTDEVAFNNVKVWTI